MEAIHAYEKQLESKLASLHPMLDHAERQTGIRKTLLVMYAATIIASMILSYPFPGLFTSIMTLAYPLFATARAADGHDKAEDVQWLAFWAVFGAMHFVELFLGSIILYRVPLYWAMRLGLMMWCYLPMTRGATVIWERAFRPALHVIVPVGGATGMRGKHHGNVSGGKNSKLAHEIEKKREEKQANPTLHESGASGSGEVKSRSKLNDIE